VPGSTALTPAYTLLIDGELPPTEFFEAFTALEVRAKSITNYAFGNTRITLYLVQHHEVGLAFDPGLAVLVATDGIRQRIDVDSVGTLETLLSGGAPTIESENLTSGLYVDLFRRARNAGTKVQEIGRLPDNPSYRDPNSGPDPNPEPV
jgi:hypothetical protein